MCFYTSTKYEKIPSLNGADNSRPGVRWPDPARIDLNTTTVTGIDGNVFKIRGEDQRDDRFVGINALTHDVEMKGNRCGVAGADNRRQLVVGIAAITHLERTIADGHRLGDGWNRKVARSFAFRTKNDQVVVRSDGDGETIIAHGQ